MTLLLGSAYMLVMGAVFVSMTILLLKGKRARYNLVYLLCQGMAALWCCSQILILLARTREELQVSYLLGNIGICFVGFCWYYFALMYTGKKHTGIRTALPFAASALHYLLVLTNPLHRLYYAHFSTEEITYGIFFYTNVCMTYGLVLAGAVILYRNLEADKRARQLIAASVLVPVLLNWIYLTGFIKPSFDITPLGFGISGILVLLATIKYRFLEVNITAFDVVLSGLEDGVGIFNRNGKPTYSNRSFYSLLRIEREGDGKRSMRIEAVLERIEGLTQQEDSVFQDARGRFLQIQVYQSVKQEQTGMTLLSQSNQEKPDFLAVFAPKADRLGLDSLTREEEQMQLVPLARLDRGRTAVFVVKDMSRYYELLRQTRELAIANEKLALEKERNRIAQQVHDTAGHTLTMIQSCMKLAAISAGKQEAARVEEYLAQAQALSSEGIRELRESINQLRREASYELVTQGIVQLADQVKEISVDVTVQGEDSERYSHLSKVLYDCTRESITNALKYSEAGRMEIIVRFQTDSVELIICDDGKGCAVLEENNGIRGIRERVEEMGGSVRFLTAEGEGFLTRIGVPV